MLKRHVAGHDADKANNGRKRDVVRASRVAQACEACSQHHLRCEDNKPCSLCRKKNIPCRVPADGSIETDAFLPEDVDTSLQHEAFIASHDFAPELNGEIDGQQVTSQQHMTEQPMMEGSLNQDSMPSFDELAALSGDLSEFLRTMPPFESCISGQATPRGIMDMRFNLDLDLNDLDIAFLDQYNLNIPFNVETPSTDHPAAEQGASAHLHDSVHVRHEAFKRSVWRYLPRSDRDFGAAEEPNLAFIHSDGNATNRSQLPTRRAIQERLKAMTRDKIFALVLSTCNPSNVGRIAAAFPSTDLLDGLIQYFLTSPTIDARRWLHIPTFSPSKLSPEILALYIAAGAVSTPDVPLRKLGFALHEAGRTGQARAFENDNTSIRDLESLRSLMLQLEIGLWSGMSRKMEIAESFLQPLITMVRRGGRFRSSMWKEITPSSSDNGVDLEKLWLQWIAQESYLRLVYRVFEHDRQSSMALLKPPLISYSEMQLPLPCADKLWHAHTSTAWKDAHLSDAIATAKHPSPVECLLDLDCLHRYESASLAYLYMVWGMVWEYRQMTSINTKPAMQNNSSSLVLSSRQQELTKALDDFRVGSPSKEGGLVLELMFIHLNAPLEDIQLFAGIEGQEEARRVYPFLREWVTSSSARQALWHSGQIFHLAKSLPKGRLCDFNAIAVYHAGIILWGYSFIKRSVSSMVNVSSAQSELPVNLDGDYDLSVRRFIRLDRGLASIQSHQPQDGSILISNIADVLDQLIELYRANHDSTDGSCPPLVENLVQLIESLRSAAR